MTVSPALAAANSHYLPNQRDTRVFGQESDQVARDYPRHGWGDHHRHDDGISAGDVLAGLLVIGGIAAVASAASKNSKTAGEPYHYPDGAKEGGRDGADYGNPREEPSTVGRNSRNLDAVVDKCVREVERSQPVDTVESVDRDGDGWRVEGVVRSGEDFTCDVDRDGRIQGISVDGNPPPSSMNDRAPANDDRYDDNFDVAANGREEPAPQDNYGSQRSAKSGGGDDRYETARAPDFSQDTI
jgi:hypothetical protein